MHFGIAIPLAMLIGASRGAKNGIVFNSARTFEQIKKVNAVVFDKTGTLTYGSFTLQQIYGDQSYLGVVYGLENVSLHPLAKAFVKYAQQKAIKLATELKEIKEEPGIGLFATDDQHNHYALTSLAYIKEQNYLISANLLAGLIKLSTMIFS